MSGKKKEWVMRRRSGWWEEKVATCMVVNIGTVILFYSFIPFLFPKIAVFDVDKIYDV